MQKERGLRPELCECLFVGEGSLFELYLVGDSVNLDIPCFGKGNVVFFPFLPEPFGDHFLKNLASVVLGILDGGAEEVSGAEDGQGTKLQKLLLLVVGLEAEGVASSTACPVKLADVGEQVGACEGEDNRAVGLEAEDILIGVGSVVVTLDKVVVDGGVHWGISFLYCN